MKNLNEQTIKMIANGQMTYIHAAVLVQTDLLNPDLDLDTLQQTRVCSTLVDANQDLLKQLRPLAIREAEMLYPDEVAAGKDFEHKGVTYNVKARNEYDFTHHTGDPLYGQWRELKKQSEKLTAEKAAITGQIAALTKQILVAHPNIKPAKSDRVLSIKKK